MGVLMLAHHPDGGPLRPSRAAGRRPAAPEDRRGTMVGKKLSFTGLHNAWMTAPRCRTSLAA
jgi:hypothetical protein